MGNWKAILYLPFFALVLRLIVGASSLRLLIMSMCQRNMSIFEGRSRDMLSVKMSSNIKYGYRFKRRRYINMILTSILTTKVVKISKSKRSPFQKYLLWHHLQKCHMALTKTFIWSEKSENYFKLAWSV